MTMTRFPPLTVLFPRASEEPLPPYGASEWNPSRHIGDRVYRATGTSLWWVNANPLWRTMVI